MKSTIVQAAFSLLSAPGANARLSVLLFHKVLITADPLMTGELDLARFDKILDFLASHTTHHINVVCIGDPEEDGWLGVALKKLYGVKLIVYVASPALPLANCRLELGNKCKAFLDAAADKIVACDALTSLMGVKPESVVLIQDGDGLAQMGKPVATPFSNRLNACKAPNCAHNGVPFRLLARPS